MKKILFVEDTKLFAGIVINKIKEKLAFEVKWLQTYSDTVKELNNNIDDYFIAILDYNLPDSYHGEIVDFVLSKNIPSVIFTSNIDDNLQDKLWNKGVVDYILKEKKANIDYLLFIIERIYNNIKTKALVVEDSDIFREFIKDLLLIHKYQVFTTNNGEEALDIINKNNDIKLVIVDQYMSNMDGLQLTSKIREKHGKEKMAVIGLSAQGNKILSAKFIKNGANDFIIKPFLREEFYCRINQNITMIEYIEKIENASNIDYLTSLYNRRFFFNSGKILLANAKRKHNSIITAMIDIDHFKKINDRYGHITGDVVLKVLAKILTDRFRESDIICRFGGEEFCILATDINKDDCIKIFEGLRKYVEKKEMIIENNKISITISIGICTELLDNLDEMVKKADDLLYKAKNNGRNKIMIF